MVGGVVIGGTVGAGADVLGAEVVGGAVNATDGAGAGGAVVEAGWPDPEHAAAISATEAAAMICLLRSTR
jgi:hypothetical protein